MCLLTQERYKTYQTGFSFGSFGGGGGGGGNSTRFGVWVTYMKGTCTGTIFWVPAPWGLGEGPKGQISLNMNYKDEFKGFKPIFVYLLTNERYITYQTGFSQGRLGHAQGWDLGVPWGVPGQFFFFSKIQPDLVYELLTWMAHAPAQFFGSPPPGALERGQKFNFLNRDMWHIKLKGMSSRPRYTEQF